MRIIAVANQKGGCGKTTVALNLSACLAREGQRTVLVDVDPQGHCALGLAVPEEQVELTISDVLLHHGTEGGPDMARIAWQISNNFDLAPSKTDLASLESRLAGVADKEMRLRGALERVSDKYDFVIIDSPPTIGFLMLSALYAADEVLVPVDTGYFALHGLAKQLETIRDVPARTGRPLTLRILGNLYDVRTKLAREILAELKKRHQNDILTSFINFNTKLKEATSFGQPITEYDPASIGCRDFVRLARELIALGAGPTVPSTILEQADAIAAEAEKLLATSQTLLGAERRQGPGRPDDEESVELELVATGRAPEAITGSSSRPSAETAAARTSPRAQAPTLPTPREIEARHEAVSRERAADAETMRKIERIYGVQPVDGGMMFAACAPGAASVRLVGDFNGWNAEVTPMRRHGDGRFEIAMPLGPGRYKYRYVVDGRWVNDPFNHDVEPNPFGELNSVVVVR